MKIKIDDGTYEFQFNNLELKWICGASDIFDAKEFLLSALENKIDQEITSMLSKYCDIREGIESEICKHKNITCYEDNLNEFYCKNCGADVTK